MTGEPLLHGDITGKVLQAFYHAYNTLGYGFLERVYENAMMITLRKMGVAVEEQVQIKVHFEGDLVGEYFADLVVGGAVIVELKAAERLCPEHEAQLLNYLKATPIEVGLLLNFGEKPEFRRRIFTNDRKPNLSK